MKKENAFTLIELLAVIIILAIIAIIATPIAINIIEDTKKNAFKNTAYGLIDAMKLKYAENYLKEHTGDLIYTFPNTTGLSFKGKLPDGGVIRLTDKGKVSLAVYNDKWCAVKGLDASEVTLTDYVEGKCILQEEADVPIITLNGEEIIYLSLGKTYTEPGYSVKTVGGIELANNTVKTSVTGQTTGKTEIDTREEEIYTITYVATHKGKTSSATRMVHVGNYKPSIKIEPNGTDNYKQEIELTISVSAFEEYTIDGFSYVIIKDGVEGNLTRVNEQNKTISLNESGVYTIKVIATDSDGNTNEVTSEMYYMDHTKPTIDLVLPDNVINENGWSKTDITLNVVTNDTGGSTIHNYKYCYGNDCTPNTTGSGNIIIISDEGENNYVCAISIDGAENESEKVCVGPYKIDKTIPNAMISPNSHSDWTNNNEIIVTPSDNISGVDDYVWKYRTSTNGGTSYGDWKGIETGFDSNSTYVLSGGVNVPVKTGTVMNLLENQKYQISFDYMITSGSSIFNVDLHPDSLPEKHPTATTQWQTFTWDVSSSSTDMNKSMLRFFNDKVKPNPADISIKNINLYPKEKAIVTIPEGNNVKIQVQVTDNALNQNIITSGIYKVDKTSPTLSIPGDVVIVSSEATNYDLMNGVTTTDNSGSATISKSGSLSSVAGIYPITYTATDKAGNTTTKQRTITVIETTNWTFTSNGTFTVPITGTYTIEMHGGGGGGGGAAYAGIGTSGYAAADGGAGGGSGEVYTTTLIAGNTYDITIGAGGAAGAGSKKSSVSSNLDSSADDGSKGGTTKFGSLYSVAGGGGGGGAFAGAHQFSKEEEIDGSVGTSVGSLASGKNGGATTGSYGDGGSGGACVYGGSLSNPTVRELDSASSGKPGAVIIKWLGL